MSPLSFVFEFKGKYNFLGRRADLPYF